MENMMMDTMERISRRQKWNLGTTILAIATFLTFAAAVVVELRF